MKAEAGRRTGSSNPNANPNPKPLTLTLTLTLTPTLTLTLTPTLTLTLTLTRIVPEIRKLFKLIALTEDKRVAQGATDAYATSSEARRLGLALGYPSH